MNALNKIWTLLVGLYDWIAFWLLGPMFVVSCVAATIVFAPPVALMPRRWARRSAQFIIMWTFRVYLGLLQLSGRVRCDLSELDSLRADTGLVIAPNHPALIDVVLIASRLPRITCIMKAELWDNFFLGIGARLAGYIRNNSPASMVKDAAQQVRDGSQLLIFPEGTRTVRPPVNAFKGGFALIAKHAKVPVQTVFIETNSPFLGKRWPLWKKPAMPIYYRVRLGRRFAVEADAKRLSETIENYFQEELTGRLAAPIRETAGTPLPLSD